MTKRGLIYVWTGIGAGKTTSALGVALREVGHGNKAIIVQFMKGLTNIGEFKIANKLSPNYEIYQFGTKHWVDLHHPSKKDIKHAEDGLKFAFKMLKKKPDLLVLDEINLAMAYKLLSTKKVLKLLKEVPAKTSVFLTGRFVPLEIMEIADYVTEFMTIKRPKKIITRKGIEY
ncbi:cob(I)yrinic acid a,c-diamide adenosyltransferase [Candidatus Woesearchaeota archaeon CG10_big_fil_rev_8_21_14_0_10_30_7]|nr:MAG: cob(I)yrinic acid a,c-diamide adenosyltransferase [Candidatus Woesearchaeota archaeon CG10_big_fil_rev_8_21_14_0_10_30_7]